MDINETKYRTITLTNRPPVRIKEDDWPVMAQGQDKQFEGQFESQSNRTTKIAIRVRQHADGRAVVYGVYEYDTRWQGERCDVQKAGVLVAAGADIVAAIRSVSHTLQQQTGVDRLIQDVERECIADLPPEDI